MFTASKKIKYSIPLWYSRMYYTKNYSQTSFFSVIPPHIPTVQFQLIKQTCACKSGYEHMNHFRGPHIRCAESRITALNVSLYAHLI